MDDTTGNSLTDSGASDSSSGFWSGLGQALGSGLSAVANKQLNGNQLTPGTPTTQQTTSQKLAAAGINPTWLIAGGVAVVGLFGLLVLSNARR